MTTQYVEIARLSAVIDHRYSRENRLLQSQRNQLSLFSPLERKKAAGGKKSFSDFLCKAKPWKQRDRVVSVDGGTLLIRQKVRRRQRRHFAADLLIRRQRPVAAEQDVARVGHLQQARDGLR